MHANINDELKVEVKMSYVKDIWLEELKMLK